MFIIAYEAKVRKSIDKDSPADHGLMATNWDLMVRDARPIMMYRHHCQLLDWIHHHKKREDQSSKAACQLLECHMHAVKLLSKLPAECHGMVTSFVYPIIISAFHINLRSKVLRIVV